MEISRLGFRRKKNYREIFTTQLASLAQKKTRRDVSKGLEFPPLKAIQKAKIPSKEIERRFAPTHTEGLKRGLIETGGL